MPGPIQGYPFISGFPADSVAVFLGPFVHVFPKQSVVGVPVAEIKCCFTILCEVLFEQRHQGLFDRDKHFRLVIPSGAGFGAVVMKNIVDLELAGVQIGGIHSHQREADQEHINAQPLTSLQLLSDVNHLLDVLFLQCTMPPWPLPGRLIELEWIVNPDQPLLFAVVSQPGLTVDESNACRVAADAPRTFSVLVHQRPFPVPHQRGSDLADVHLIFIDVGPESIESCPVGLLRLAFLL